VSRGAFYIYFISIVSGCDGGNRTRNVAVYWRLLVDYFSLPEVPGVLWLKLEL
jgi:hypothetical protein